jgi:hypothetical protein
VSTLVGTSAAPAPNLGAALMLVDIREAARPVRLLEKAYSKAERDQAAKDGAAMSDGGYPIKTKADIENAVDDWGRTGSDPSVKAHIIEQAKKIDGGTDVLPSDWDASTKPLRESIAAATKTMRLREAAFPLLSDYDIAAAMRISGELWADAQQTGNTEDEADAASLAKTLKRVLDRHAPEVELGGCGCGPVCCC